MNGATAELPSAKAKPINSSITIIGVSHHFLFMRRNAISSVSGPRRPQAC